MLNVFLQEMASMVQNLAQSGGGNGGGLSALTVRNVLCQYHKFSGHSEIWPTGFHPNGLRT